MLYTIGVSNLDSFVKTVKMAKIQCKIEVERRSQDLFQYKAH